MNFMRNTPLLAIRSFSSVIALLVMMKDATVYAQSIAPIQNMEVSADASKCGWIENDCQPLSPHKYFLVNTYTANATYSYYGYSGDDAGTGCYSTVKYTFKEKIVQTEDIHTCSATSDYSGTANYSDNVNSIGDGDCGSNLNYSGSIVDSSGDWDDGGATAMSMGGGDGSGYQGTVTTTCTSTTSSSTKSDSWNYLAGSTSWGAGSTSSQSQTGLSDEYTDSMLHDEMMNRLPAYPTDLITNWSPGSGTAFYSLSADHTSCSGGKMKYKFFLSNGCTCQKGQQFLLKWEEITTYPDGSQPSIKNMSETVTDNGDPDGVYSSIHEVQVPGSPCSITATSASVTPIPSSGGGGPGSGGAGD